MIISALELHGLDVFKKLNKIIQTDEKFIVQLEKLQDFFINIPLAYNQGCLLTQARRIQGDLSKEAVELLISIEQKFVKTTELWIKSAIRRKEVSKNVKPRIGAHLILSLIGFCQTAISSGKSSKDVREVMSLSLLSLTSPQA